MNRLAKAVLKWGVVPIALLLLAAGIGQRLSGRRGKLGKALASLPESDRKDLELVPGLAVANATWAFGSSDSLKKMFKTELDRLPESENIRRGLVFVRSGIVETDPDAQAAFFSQACGSDPRMCDHLREAAQREVHARFVPPGNVLPLSLSGGHPPIPGPR
jgi:hypothetical protein